MKKINIFLASSGELKAQREKIKELIRTLNSKIFNKDDIYLNLNIWEDESKSIQAERIQNNFNKLLEESEIVIVLFYTKAGKFTIEEFELAYQNNKMRKKPWNLFICFDKSPIEHDIIRKRKKDIEVIHEIEDKIENDEQLYIKYNSSDELHTKLHDELVCAVPEIIKKMPQSSPKKQNLSTFNSKEDEIHLNNYLYCNRHEQVYKFKESFEQLYLTSNKVQYYIIHGQAKQSHSELVNRLILEAEEIVEENNWDYEIVKVPLQCEWDFSGSINKCQNTIEKSIKKEIKGICEASKEKLDKPRILFIRYMIDGLYWDSQHIELLQWYFKSCWEKINYDHMFIIFFEITYNNFFSQLLCGYPCIRIQTHLKKLKNQYKEQCRILPRLQSFKYSYIEQWLHGKIKLDTGEIKKIYKNYKFKKSFKKYSMEAILNHLKNIEFEYLDKRLSGLHE